MSLDNYKGQRVENRATVINDVYTVQKSSAKDQDIRDMSSQLNEINQTLLLILEQLEMITGE